MSNKKHWRGETIVATLIYTTYWFCAAANLLPKWREAENRQFGADSLQTCIYMDKYFEKLAKLDF